MRPVHCGRRGRLVLGFGRAERRDPIVRRCTVGDEFAPGARTMAAWDFCPPRTCFCQACLTRAHRRSSGVETRVIEPYTAAQLVVKHAANSR